MIIENLKPTEVYDTYWKFACERQEIFYRRIQNQSMPWTKDDILSRYKFTNAYRASDRTSQYLIRNVIYCGKKFTDEDILFRIILFKLFNKIETWEYIEKEFGTISYADYNYENYNKVLMRRITEGQRIYSAAYIMPSGKEYFGFIKKHQNNLKLLEYMMQSKLPVKVAKARSLKELYEILLSYPTLGTFLSYQFAIDINYSELCNFDEMSYIVAGPGAKNGISKCFENTTPLQYEDIIKIVADSQEEEFEKRGLDFKNLFGRRLQLIDCQNLFCETDKYARIRHPEIGGLNNRKRIKQKYMDTGKKSIVYFYPPKWGINCIINEKMSCTTQDIVVL